MMAAGGRTRMRMGGPEGQDEMVGMAWHSPFFGFNANINLISMPL